jgi:hypothetical protein
MLKPVLIFCLMLMFAHPTVTVKQVKLNPGKDTTRFKTDSSNVNLRHFDSAALKKYSADPTFDYTVNKRPVTWWARFWNWVGNVLDAFFQWLGELFRRLFGGVRIGKSAFSVFRFVIILILVFLVVYIISKLMGVDLLKFLRKKQTIDEVPYSESLEDIHQINFDEAIENALSAKDHRLAVRLLYLRCLKQLSDANLINWKIEKTNNAYLNELTNEEQRRRFALVTRQFEYVWYGDFPVDGTSFSSINNFFQEFKQSVS